jgi:hypothetical protein
VHGKPACLNPLPTAITASVRVGDKSLDVYLTPRRNGGIERGASSRAPRSLRRASKFSQELGLSPIEDTLLQRCGSILEPVVDPRRRAEQLGARSGGSSDLDMLAPEIDLDVVLYAAAFPMDGVNRFEEHESPAERSTIDE